MDNVDLIIQTFENLIGDRVCAIHKFDNVPNNQVFKIETALQSYIFKIYAKRDWPENGKIPFITDKLNEYNIPHAKLFIFERENSNFPNGFLIEECLPGITADKLTLSKEENINLYKKLALLVSRVHQIKLKNYGYTGGGIAAWSTFSGFINDMFEDSSNNLKEKNIFDALKLDKIHEKLYDKLKECDGYPAVICHNDLSTKNIIVNKEDIVLIDWDDVQSLIWMADIARMTLWMKLNYDSKTADEYRRVFLEYYETEYDKKAFDELEAALHVWYGLDYLNFALVAPNYQYQCETLKMLLHEALLKSGIGVL